MRRIGLSLTGVASCLVLAVVCVIVSTPPMALAKNPKVDKRGGGKTTTALVTITGPMQTMGPETFLIKDSKRTLTLTRGVWTDQGAVPIKFDFFETVPGNCTELRSDSLILESHLIDFAGTDSPVLEEFPVRWGVSIVIDMSSLGEFDPDGPNPCSTTNIKGGHSIDITTDPDLAPTITRTRERLWIPEGPSKSGSVTVEWVCDKIVGKFRTRVFEFTQFEIQVWTDTGGNIDPKIMRCYNKDGAITVTVVTEL